MIEELRSINKKLLKVYKDDKIIYRRHKLIEKILNEKDAFLKMDVEMSFAVLKDLGIKEEYLEKVYMELI